MDAEFSTAHVLSPDQRKRLQTRRDGPGLVRLSVQLLGLVGSGVLVWVSAREPGPLLVLALLGLAIFQATLFAPMHECGHATAFATRWLDELGLHLCAALMLMPGTGFRQFHFEHHRKTHVEGDPELPNPAFAAWPTNPIAWLVVLSGQPMLLGKLAAVAAAAIGRGPKWWQRWLPYVPERVRPRIAWEARVLLAILLGLIALAIWVDARVWWLLAGYPLSHLVLGPYLAAEHTGLSTSEADVLARTRSIRCSAITRWLFWNMPLHAEHHGWPAVPFHALPALHELLGDALPQRGRGYAAIHWRGLRAALRLAPPCESDPMPRT